MKYLIGFLIIFIILLVIYLLLLQSQIRSMSRQLNRRIKDQSRQPVSLELISSDLNQLAVNINQCLKAEETLRLNGVREEKRFKEMIADISHDLRTPLTAIKGYLQLMEKDELTDEQRKKLQIARKHTDELGQLIEHFFEYSYLINSEPVPVIERFNLTNLVVECLAASVTVFEDHNIAVHFEEAPPIIINADKEMVIRIVQNLIRNSIQHTDGDVTVQLVKEHNVSLSFQNPVKNPGDIDISRIFDRFYTADKARSRSTGLGLAIVRLLAEQMGGSTEAALDGNVLKISVTMK